MSPAATLIAGLLRIFNMLLLLWCLLSWFPNVNWYAQPFRTLDNIIKPVIEPFRRVIPPIGNIDISPIVAILCLQFVAQLIVQFL